MPFLLLLVLTITCLQPRWPTPPSWLEPSGIFGLVWGGIFGLLLLAGLLSKTFRHELVLDPGQRLRLLRRFATLRRYHALALLGFYLMALYFFGWGWTVKEFMTTLGGLLPGQELLILAPLLVGLVLSWTRFYEVEQAAHTLATGNSETFLDRWGYVVMQIRHNLLLVVAPLFLLLVQQIVLWLFPQLQENVYCLPLLGLGLLLAVFLCTPLLLRLILGLHPLPAGPLRDQLLAAAHRLNFRCTDFMVWNTRHTMANALVTGPLPFLRYLVLSDRLIRDLTPEEIEAVMGHEIGHIKHRHMLYYLAFLLTSLVAIGGMWNALQTFLTRDSWPASFLSQSTPLVIEYLQSLEIMTVLPLLTLMVLYLFVVFGYLSRRCERQADIFGCRTTSYQVFISALEKVAALNGIPRDRPGWLSSWQHSTIANRVDFLRRLEADPTLEPGFQRHVQLVKWSIALSLGGALWALGLDNVWNVLSKL